MIFKNVMYRKFKKSNDEKDILKILSEDLQKSKCLILTFNINKIWNEIIGYLKILIRVNYLIIMQECFS